MQIAVAAYPIDWHNRWNEYVGKLRLWTRLGVESGARLLVYPEFAALELASLAGEDNASDAARAVEALTARIKDVDDLHASLAREFGSLILAASGPLRTREGEVFNRARLFAPDGRRWTIDQAGPPEALRAAWGVSPAPPSDPIETALGPIGVLIGADVTRPELAAGLAAAGARLLLVPALAANPEAAAGLRAEAEARAAETGCVVALAVGLGPVDWLPALGKVTGTAAILGPDGVLAEGKAHAPGWVRASLAAGSVEWEVERAD